MAVALATSHVCLSGQVVPLLHKPANRRQCTRKTRALHNESSSSRSNPARKASVQEESQSATTENPLQSQEKARFLQLEENKPRERALRGRAPHVSKDEKKLLGRRRLLSKGLLAAVCCPLCSQLQTASAAEWSYGGPSGPTGWGGFCAFGRQQSPVDVPVKGSQLKMDALGKLHFNYSAADVTVVNTGHGTMQVNFPAGNSSLRVGSRTFDLVQFHFHSPSEHAIDGERFDMEAHMVHKERETGLLAVVGTLIQGVPNAEAFPNPALAAALELAPSERGATRVAEICSPTCALVKVSAEDLLPPKDSYFHYQGSLTTPPCSEGVEWFLMAETLRIQDTQLVQFLRYMGTKNRALALNSRPLQPMKGREITRGPTREI